MLKVELICIGKLKEDYLRKACAEYEKRLASFCKLEVIELPESKVSQNPSDAEIAACIQKEGEKILSKISPQSYVVTLCIEGEMVSSPELAKKVQQIQNQGDSRLVLIIGGSFGLSQEVKELSRWKFSMSPMTFPHQLARVMVLEQLYRAMGINNNSKYHK